AARCRARTRHARVDPVEGRSPALRRRPRAIAPEILPQRRGALGRHLSETHFGCTFGFPPGVPGGGMTLSRPPPGGATCISGSTPVGGQMTPSASPSLSLNTLELPPPTVGGSPFVSG